MSDVVENVRNVVGSELSKPTTTISAMPTIPGHANSEWSNILPAILTGEPDVGMHQPIPSELENKYAEASLPGSEGSTEKAMIPVQLVTKDEMDNRDNVNQGGKPTYEIMNTISHDQVPVNDQVGGASGAMTPILLLPTTSKPELSDGNHKDDVHNPDNPGAVINENNKVTVSVIAESSSSSVKVSGHDEVQIHHENPLDPNAAPSNMGKPSPPTPIPHNDKVDPTEAPIIPNIITPVPSGDVITENPQNKESFSTFTIVSDSNSGDVHSNGNGEPLIPHGDTADLTTTANPISKDNSVPNDINHSINSVINQVTDPALAVTPTLEDHKPQIIPDKAPIPSDPESKDSEDLNEFRIEDPTTPGSTTTDPSNKAAGITNPPIDSSSEVEGSGLGGSEAEGSGAGIITSEEITNESSIDSTTSDPNVPIINSEETITGGSSSESHDDKPEIIRPELTGPEASPEISPEIGKETSSAAPEQKNDPTESPIVRISVKEPEENITINNVHGTENDGQSNIVRIQPTNSMSSVHNILENATPTAAPDHVDITLPTDKPTTANNLASGLIAGFDNHKPDTQTMITTIMFDELPKVTSKGGSKDTPSGSSGTNEASSSDGLNDRNGVDPLPGVTEKPQNTDGSSNSGALSNSAGGPSDPLGNPITQGVPISPAPGSDITTPASTESGPIIENPVLSSAEVQSRPKGEKKETGTEGFVKVPTIPHPPPNNPAPEPSKTPQAVPESSTESTIFVPVSQPEHAASNSDIVGPPEVRVTPPPAPGVPGLDASTKDLNPDNAHFYSHSNELAFKMWTAINSHLKSSRTVAISPFGLFGMLGMIYLGAGGATSEEMDKILKLDGSGRTFNPHLVFKNVSETINAARNQDVANNVFVEELFADKGKLSLRAYYKDKVSKFYDGIIAEVKFNSVSDVVRRRTNMQVRKGSGGNILNFIRGDQLPLRTPMSALSANIFQTNCSADYVSTKDTDRELYFTVSTDVNKRRSVPLPSVVWKSGVHAGYELSLDATAFAIGSRENVVSTIFVVPGDVVRNSHAPGDNLEKLERRLVDLSLREGAWNKLLKQITPRPSLELKIPRFSHTSIINATAALKSMGLNKMFTKEARLVDTANLHLADIFQMNLFTICHERNAYIGTHHEEVYPTAPARSFRNYEELDPIEESPKVDETNRSPKFSRKDDNLVRIDLSDPFLYFVRHNPTGLILHMGRFSPKLT